MAEVGDEQERAARALVAAGRPADAVEALRGLTNLTAHDGGPLPCLCRRCLDPARTESEAQGQRFRRDFALHAGRVLWFWVPVELADDERGVRRSVESAMRTRLKPKRRGRGSR